MQYVSPLVPSLCFCALLLSPLHAGAFQEVENLPEPAPQQTAPSAPGTVVITPGVVTQVPSSGTQAIPVIIPGNPASESAQEQPAAPERKPEPLPAVPAAPVPAQPVVPAQPAAPQLQPWQLLPSEAGEQEKPSQTPQTTPQAPAVLTPPPAPANEPKPETKKEEQMQLWQLLPLQETKPENAKPEQKKETPQAVKPKEEKPKEQAKPKEEKPKEQPAKPEKPRPEKPRQEKPKPEKPQPEKPKPEKPKTEKPKPGDPLRIPPEALTTGNLDFLEGCWQGTRPEYYSQRTIKECFCFGKGGGQAKRFINDFSQGRNCTGSARARLDGRGVLHVNSEGAYCSDGENWGAAEMVCTGTGQKTPCSWVFTDAGGGSQSKEIPFIRVNSCGR